MINTFPDLYLTLILILLMFYSYVVHTQDVTVAGNWPTLPVLYRATPNEEETVLRDTNSAVAMRTRTNNFDRGTAREPR